MGAAVAVEGGKAGHGAHTAIGESEFTEVGEVGTWLSCSHEERIGE